MSGLPIRARLTAVFAAATLVVLAGAAAFVYLSLRADLDEAVNATLAARAEAVAAMAKPGGPGLSSGAPAMADDPEEEFAQVLTDDARVRAVLGAVREPALSPALARAAERGTVMVERKVPGLEGSARVLARPVPGDPRSIVVVGRSLDDRDETLGGVIGSFAVGGPIAVLVASLLGYTMATVALRPVEAMRRRAAAVSAADDTGPPLPLPRAHDEIRRLGETLNAMLARLRGAFDRERRFVADASHELRTPIAVLKTELEAALRRGGHSPTVRESLLAALAEADHLARLADDLFVLARSAEGRLAVRPEPLAAMTLLDDARTRFAARAAAEGRRISVDAPADVTVRADPQRVRQVLDNLLDNALRHGRGDVALVARAGAGVVEIDVADAGPGFSADLAERAFERFARGDDARTRGGTGLGLAIVHAIAEAHGGRAEVVPVATGASVRVTLPASQVHLSARTHDVGIQSDREVKGPR